MVKNRHLLAAIVALGAVNLLAFVSLIFSERASARGLRALERDAAADREELRRLVDALQIEAGERHRQVEELRAGVEQVRDELVKVRALAAETRKALEAVEERLNKSAGETRPEAGREKAP